MQGRSENRWSVIAHRRGGKEAWLARGGIREHDAFLGHEMRGPAGTWRGGVSIAGGREGQGARKGTFCVLINMNSFIPHIYFIYISYCHI